MSASELPPLPPIEGSMNLMLDVHTHPSLIQPHAQMQEDYGDIHRLSELGARAFDMAVTYHLFAKKPMMRVEEIQSERARFLSAEQAYDWVTNYGLKHTIRIPATEISLLNDPNDMQAYFYTYIGALYLRHGHGAVIQNWVSKLIDPSYIADVNVPGEEPKTNAAPLPPAYSSAGAPNPFAQQFTPPPPTGSAPPLPNSPPPRTMSSSDSTDGVPSSMMSLVTLSLVNQTAVKKGVVISYSAVASGPPHQPTWTVRCMINDQERGVGMGKSQKQAKEDAARQAWVKMGW